MSWVKILIFLLVLMILSGLAYGSEWQWRSYTHFSKAQTLSKLPGFVAHGNLTSDGYYVIHYGYAGPSGTSLPPSDEKKEGEYYLSLGRNYAISFTGSLKNPMIVVEDVTNKMPSTPGMIQIYVKNDMVREGFLGVMLRRSRFTYVGEGRWKSYTYYFSRAWTLSNLLGFVAHGNLTVGGKYYVYYGYAGLSGTTIPPAEVKKAGPYDLVLGRSYAISFTGSLSNPIVSVEDVTNKMPSTPGMIQIYVKNDMVREGFLGVMLKK